MGELTKWDKRFLDLAFTVAEWSKDTNTKTGAVIVHDEENTELVVGYNGFPRGANDNKDPKWITSKRYEKPLKYMWTEHAERNAIYKAARLGISVNGARMYCTYFPCVDCARAIINSGISKVYTEKPDFNHKTWGESWLVSMEMFRECGVDVIWTNLDDFDWFPVAGYKRGEVNKCRYEVCWAGTCGADTTEGKTICEKHSEIKCGCGEQATQECSGFSGSFVCCRPLCDSCKKSHQH